MDYCLKKGKGIPLIFLHGFLGCPEDWMDVIHALPDCHCIGIDLPGHGNAPLDREWRFPTAHIIGYSMGGRLAMNYAKQFPDRTASLTILSAHQGLSSGHDRRLAMDQIWAQKIRTNFDAFLQEWYSQPLFAKFVPDLARRKKNNPALLAECLLQYSLAKQELFSLDHALVMVGEKDTLYRELYPKALCIEHAGHQVHLENPQAVAKALQQHLGLS